MFTIPAQRERVSAGTPRPKRYRISGSLCVACLSGFSETFFKLKGSSAVVIGFF